MTAVAAFLTKLNPTWQALTALAGATAVGIVVGITLYGFTGLPDRVEAVEASSAKNTVDIARGRGEYETLICLLTLPDSLTPIESQRRCGL